LRARNDEIQLLDRWLLGFKKHRNWSAKRLAPSRRRCPMSRCRHRLGCALVTKTRKDPTENMLDQRLCSCELRFSGERNSNCKNEVCANR
jgi:hypothetical protein